MFINEFFFSCGWYLKKKKKTAIRALVVIFSVLGTKYFEYFILSVCVVVCCLLALPQENLQLLSIEGNEQLVLSRNPYGGQVSNKYEIRVLCFLGNSRVVLLFFGGRKTQRGVCVATFYFFLGGRGFLSCFLFVFSPL